VVYGVIALALLPGAALVAMNRPDTQRSAVLAVAGIVLAVLLFRLVETGG
jgi:hypothetical protein